MGRGHKRVSPEQEREKLVTMVPVLSMEQGDSLRAWRGINSRAIMTLGHLGTVQIKITSEFPLKLKLVGTPGFLLSESWAHPTPPQLILPPEREKVCVDIVRDITFPRRNLHPSITFIMWLIRWIQNIQINSFVDLKVCQNKYYNYLCFEESKNGDGIW